MHAGIKKQEIPDLALIVSEPPARAAGIFTRNRFPSPSVQVSRMHVRSGECRALLVNSGNANACTGERGLRDAVELCRRTARAVGGREQEVLVASTGVIGVPLPIERVRRALPRLVRGLDPGGFPAAAEAIRTTDRLEKHGWAQVSVGGRQVTLFGMAKGAGMICPNMATMLAFFFTDLRAPAPALRRLLREGAAESFNRIQVDGDQSTNDTVLLLANGLADNAPAAAETSEYRAFASILFPMMRDLATRIVRDGEGATKVVEIAVHEARTNAEARLFAYRLAGSPLVKTSFYGQDPNWGRLMAALGDAGPGLDPQKIDIFYDSIPAVLNGISAGTRQEARLRQVLRRESFTVSIRLGRGPGAFSLLTSDLTHDYVSLNASYRS